MKLTIYYLLVDAGDGSSYAEFFESKELAEYHERREEYCGFSSDGVSSITIETQGLKRIEGTEITNPLMFCKDVTTKEDYLEEYLSEDDDDYEQVKTDLKKL